MRTPLRSNGQSVHLTFADRGFALGVEESERLAERRGS